MSTVLSGDDIDSATPVWQHENALIRVPAQFVRWVYLSLLTRPARKTHRFFWRIYRRFMNSLGSPVENFLINAVRTIEGLILFRLCIPGGWPAATWTQRILWYGGLLCICCLVSFFIWICKTGRVISKPSSWYKSTYMMESGGSQIAIAH